MKFKVLSAIVVFPKKAHFTIEKNLRFFNGSTAEGNPLQPQTNLCRLVKFEIEFKSKGKMAIYHFSVKTISRSAGRSAVACSAYRSGEKLIDERQGKEQDYTRKTGVEFTKIYAPENTNPELLDRNHLWNTVEKVERRKDANLAREFEIAFPHELNKEQRKECSMTYAKSL